MSREPYTILEIDQDLCWLTYGTKNAHGSCKAGTLTTGTAQSGGSDTITLAATEEQYLTAADSTANGNDGTLTNGPVWVSADISDEIQGALEFTAASSHRVEVAHNAALNVGTEVTLESWVKTTDSGSQRTISKRLYPDDTGYELGVNNGKVTTFFGTASGLTAPSGFTSVNDGEWHHIAFVHDSSGNNYIYVDGVLDNSSSGSTTDSCDTTADLGIGYMSPDYPATKYLNGSMAEPRIWNTARTQSQIAANMNKRLNGDETGLVLYHKMDDCPFIDSNIELEAGTGSGQEKSIIEYDGANRQVTVASAWSTNPDATSEYRIKDPNDPLACHNTRETCKAIPSYTLFNASSERGTLTLSFVEPRVNLPRDENLLPFLAGTPSTTPVKINVGGGDKSMSPLGSRATVSVRFNDAPHSDNLVDPYLSSRSYEPLDRGTFWSKWKRRNPYYQNRACRVYEGYVGDTRAQMNVRHYFIEEISGPSGGTVTLKAKDVLKLIDNDRAKWPEQSTGTLDSAITAGATSLIVADSVIADYDPDSAGSGTVRVGDEVITWTSISTSGTGVQLTGLTRGAENTDADSHDAGDTVQRCQRYTDEGLVTVITDIMDAGGVNSAFIPTTDWNAEVDRWLDGFRVTVLLTEPYGVNELLAELTEQCLFYIWWDEYDQEIKLKAIRPVDTSLGEVIYTINDENAIIAGSFSEKEHPGERVSQVWTLYNQIDPTEDLDKFSNYKKVRIRVDADAEADAQYGEKRVRQINARFLQGDAQAATVNARVIARYRDNPKRAMIDLDAKDNAIKTGDILDVSYRELVDEFGASETRRYQVISVNNVEPSHKQRYELQRFEFTSRYAFWMANTTPVYGSASATEINSGGFWSKNDGTFNDGTEAYRWI